MAKKKPATKSGDGLPGPLQLILCGQVYRVIHAAYESFEEDHIGSDLAYLLGAILGGTYCEWSADRPIVRTLRKHFPETHILWNYIRLTPFQLADLVDPETGHVVVRLANGNTIRSGWTDEHDPDVKPAGDWLSVWDAERNREFYVEAVDFTTMDTMSVQRKLLELICACGGVPCP